MMKAMQHISNAFTIHSSDVVKPGSPSTRSSYSPLLSGEGIEADQDKVKVIKDFPTRANITDLRSFMGLVNQLAKFTPHIAAATQQLHFLMNPKRTFIWTPDHNEAFQCVKFALSSPPVLSSFDPDLPTILQTDASKLYGVRDTLLQDHGGGHLHLGQ